MEKTILVLAANPKNSTPLRLDEEVREIDTGLRRSRYRDRFRLEQRWAVRPGDLRRALLDLEPEIVHFSGHGADKDGIQLEDNNGNANPVSAATLSALFSLFPKTECVLLNACHSETQANAIAEYVECVIGMGYDISDKAAIEFAVAFYDGIGAGKPYATAYKLGCLALEMEGFGELPHPTLKTKKDFLKPSILSDYDSKVLSQIIDDFLSSDLHRIQRSATFVVKSNQIDFFQRKLLALLESALTSQRQCISIATAFTYIGDPRDQHRGYIRLPSDDELMSDLLSFNLLRVQRSASIISRENRTENFQQRLLNLFGQETVSYQQRIAIATAFAFIGDPRNLDEMMVISQGDFWLGTDANYIKSMLDRKYRYFSMDETPLQKHHLQSFFIGKYPVTNQQYFEFLQTNPGHSAPKNWVERSFPPELANHPVTYVSWFDADAYVRWKGGRLPSEFEWEKASRGNTKWQYPWEDRFEPTNANVQLENIKTTPVGVFPTGASVYGVLDLAGNVWEWTDSRYLPYPGYNGPMDSFDELSYVQRGGSYSNPSVAARCTCRLKANVREKYSNVGFRVVIPYTK